MNRTTVETEEALWLTLPDDKLVQLARDVSRATGDVLTSWSFRYTDGEFESARVRCRVAQVALFRQAQRSYGGSNKAGLPPHLSTMPLPNSTATT